MLKTQFLRFMEKMSIELKQAFTTAREEALRCRDSHIRMEHVLYAIMVGKNVISQILTENVNDLEMLLKDIESLNKRQSVNDTVKTNADIYEFDKDFGTLMSNVTKSKKKEEIITPEMVFLHSFDTNMSIIKLMKDYNVTKKFIDEKLKRLQVSDGMNMEDNNKKSDSGTASTTKAKSKTPILDNFSRDLTTLANEGKLDPIIGREKEIERVAQILTRRKKNNPVLIGDPGVGKTAIAEGLAIKIATNDCPRPLQGKRLVMLDLTAMVAGTKYRGDFEQRMKSLLEELRDNPNIILFVDELHTMIGAGNSSGALDAANVFKPALARGEVQCIGATTLDEYREHIEKDGALERRFQIVMVNPPTIAETKTILFNVREKYETFHKVSYTDDAIEEIVRLADRYITNREFPDKAMDIIDEAGARAQISIKPPVRIQELEAELKQIQEEKKVVVKTQMFEQAAELRDTEIRTKNLLENENNKWKDSLKNNKIVVDDAMICEVVSMMTGIPISNISQNEIKKLINIDKEISDSVIGQEEAVNKVASAIKRNRTGIRKQNKPIGSFLFIGPTGVGKTELAKVLAEKIFGSEDAMIRIDMSEYMEKFNVSKLIGAPPGYVGYEEGGQLTEKVKNKPYSLVLLDEIEKAHPSVFDLLLQMLDEGHLTDGLGRKINFKNTIIIMTSNIGLKEAHDFGVKIGFNTSDSNNDSAKAIIDKAIKKQFKPEFLNRLDETIFFNRLTEENILKIVDLQLNDLSSRLAESSYKFTITNEAKNKLGKLGYSETFGARELQRTIQKQVEDAMSDELLRNGMPKTAEFSVTYEENIDKVLVTML